MRTERSESFSCGRSRAERAASEGLFILNIINVRIKRLIRRGPRRRRWRIMIRPQLLQKTTAASHVLLLLLPSSPPPPPSPLTPHLFHRRETPINIFNIFLVSALFHFLFHLAAQSDLPSPPFLSVCVKLSALSSFSVQKSHITQTSQSLRYTDVETCKYVQTRPTKQNSYVTVRSVQVELVARHNYHPELLWVTGEGLMHRCLFTHVSVFQLQVQRLAEVKKLACGKRDGVIKASSIRWRCAAFYSTSDKMFVCWFSARSRFRQESLLHHNLKESRKVTQNNRKAVFVALVSEVISFGRQLTSEFKFQTRPLSRFCSGLCETQPESQLIYLKLLRFVTSGLTVIYGPMSLSGCH